MIETEQVMILLIVAVTHIWLWQETGLKRL